MNRVPRSASWWVVSVVLSASAAALLLAACGGTSTPSESPSRGLDAWEDIEPGAYFVRDAYLELADVPSGVVVSAPGRRDGEVLPGQSFRIPEGPAPSAWSNVRSCISEPLVLRHRDAVISIPAGGEVRLLGMDRDQVRIGPPFTSFSWPTTVLDRARLATGCTAEPAVAAAERRIPYRDPLFRACLFDRRPTDGPAQHVVLPRGAPLQAVEANGDWLRVRTAIREIVLTGWIHKNVLLESRIRPGVGAALTTEAATLGPLEIPAGTPVLTVPPVCPGGPHSCNEERFVLLRDTPAGPVRVEGRASELTLQPDPNLRALEIPEAPAACWFPNSPPRERAAGSLSRASIREVIQTNVGGVRGCYERRLHDMPNLEGRVRTNFIIGPTGRVHSAHVLPFEDRFVAECVRHVVQNMRFPPPRNGGVVGVSYPFALSTSD